MYHQERFATLMKKRTSYTVLSLFALLCAMPSVFGMDQLSQPSPRRQHNHSDVIKAAQNLPTQYKLGHVCIDVIENASLDFQAELILHGKGQEGLPKKKLLDDGALALQAAKSLIFRCISRVGTQDESIKQGAETKTALEGKLHRLEEQTKQQTNLLSQKQTELTNALSALSEGQQGDIQNQQKYDALSTQFTTTKQQRNLFMGAFIACALTFIGYILSVKYAAMV